MRKFEIFKNFINENISLPPNLGFLCDFFTFFSLALSEVRLNGTVGGKKPPVTNPLVHHSPEKGNATTRSKEIVPICRF